MTAARVTLTQSCETCGGSFEPRRSTRRYCSSPCRQKAYRERQARCDKIVRLTPAQRAWLRAEVDLRAREKVARLERAEAELAAMCEAA